MSKAIFGAALLAGAGIAAVVLTGGLSLPGILALTNAEINILAGIALGGVAMEAGAVASALTNNRGMAITTRQTAAARQVIYGQQRVGGVEIYRSTTGSSHDQFNYVIVLAGHEVDSIQNLYLDGRQVHWQGSGSGWSVRNGVGFGGIADGGTYTGPNGVQYNFGGTGHSGIYCEARYGDQLDGDVMASLTANDPNWAATDAGSPYVGGCCYVYLKIEYNTNLFPGEPEIRFTVNGKNNIYDPRTGTTGFTTNWALIAADVITDAEFGLGDNTVNQDQLIAAANVCDEQVALANGSVDATTEARYTTNYHTDMTASPGDTLGAMMTGAAGRLSRIGGEWYIWPAYWQGPSFSFDQGSLSGAIDWSPYRSFRDLYNRVNGTYIAPTYPYNITGNLYDKNGFYNGETQNNFPFAWQPTNFPQYACDVLHGYASDQYLTADGGVQLPKELSFSTVISVAQAQRVAKINLLRNRQQGIGSFPMHLEAWQMQPLDVMQFTFPAMGWTEKSLEVVGVSFQVADAGDESGVQSVRCTMQVQETDPSIYEWSTAEELTVYDVPATPTQTPYTPAPPTGMTLTSGAATALVTLDGVVHPRIEVQWDTPLDILTKQVQVQYTLSSPGTTWLDAGLVDVANNLFYIPNVVAGQEYNVRIRSLRANGASSSWEEIDGYTVSLTLSVVGIVALAPNTLVSEAFSDGTADIIVEGFTALVGNASVAVLPSGPYTITGLAQQTLYWVYYIDPTFAGGAITPIATTNTADFLNKVGYFLIDSITTPYAGSSGTTSSLYSPSTFVDLGSRSTVNGPSVYDGNLATPATVSSGVTATTATTGNCQWSGFPKQVLTAPMTLTVLASYSQTGTGTLTYDAAASITTTVGGTTTSIFSVTANTAEATYTLTIASGTDISTVSVDAQVSLSATNGDMIPEPSGNATGKLNIYEISIQ